MVNQFSYLSQNANEVIKIKFMLKKGVKVNQATQPAAGRAALSLRQGWKTSLRFSRGDMWMFIVCWNAYTQISSFKNQRVNSSHMFVYLFHNTRIGFIDLKRRTESFGLTGRVNFGRSSVIYQLAVLTLR